jgi:hypothetical protein
MSKRYIDFDAALAESQREPVVVRYLARDWELYPALPAKPVLRLLRMQAEAGGDTEVSAAETLACLSEMVPAGVLEAWLEGGMTVDEMAELLQAVMKAYANAGESSGEAQRPVAGQTKSSGTGKRSKPTSSASTGST